LIIKTSRDAVDDAEGGDDVISSESQYTVFVDAAPGLVSWTCTSRYRQADTVVCGNKGQLRI